MIKKKILKDDFSPQEKETKNIDDLGFTKLDPAPIITTRSWLDKPNVSDNVKIIDGNFIMMDNDSKDRFLVGKDENGEWVVKFSKPGIDVKTATNSQVLFSSSVIYFQTVISTSAASVNSDFFMTENYIIYDTGVEINLAPIVSFYKEPDWSLTSVTLRTEWEAGILTPGLTTTNPVNVGVRLNPTRSAIQGATHGYYTWSAGTVLDSGLNPSPDEVKSYVFSTSQLAQIGDGWNRIVVQQETDNGNNFGAVNLSLVLRGYINL